jgi:hypothetical protein
MTEEHNNPPKIAEELAKMQHEELLPVEKKLILVSLLAGVVLLALLLWASKALFPS